MLRLPAGQPPNSSIDPKQGATVMLLIENCGM